MVLGRAGTGKTAIATAIAGVVENNRAKAWFDGVDVMDMDSRIRARMVGYVPTNVSALFSGLRSTVSGEIDLSLDLVETPDSEREMNKAWVVSALNLDALLHRDPFSLSGGERVRVALAIVLVKRPLVLVLDQVFDHLSERARREIREVLQDFAKAGGILIEMHAYAPAWYNEIDLCVVLGPITPLIGAYLDMVRDLDQYLLDEDRWRARTASLNRPALRVAADRRGLRANGVTFTYGPGRFCLGPVDLEVQRGEAIALVGPNGAGKSTLLMTLAALLLPRGGQISINNGVQTVLAPDTINHAHEWAANVLYGFQEPDDQIYCKDVRTELQETARRFGRLESTWERTVTESLQLSRLLDESPMTLTRSLRRLVAIGCVLIAKPPVALLDEPTACLDRAQQTGMRRALENYLQQGGTCVFISHDEAFANEVATRTVHVADGKISKEIV